MNTTVDDAGHVDRVDGVEDSLDDVNDVDDVGDQDNVEYFEDDVGTVADLAAGCM